jgi:hypothetical protein
VFTEVHFQGAFACCNLYTTRLPHDDDDDDGIGSGSGIGDKSKDNSKEGVIARRRNSTAASAAKKAVALSLALTRGVERLHTLSFTYDFHLRHLLTVLLTDSASYPTLNLKHTLTAVRTQ